MPETPRSTYFKGNGKLRREEGNKPQSVMITQVSGWEISY